MLVTRVDKWVIVTFQLTIDLSDQKRAFLDLSEIYWSYKRQMNLPDSLPADERSRQAAGGAGLKAGSVERGAGKQESGPNSFIF